MELSRPEIRPIHWKGRSLVASVNKYMKNPLNTDLLAFCFLNKDAVSYFSTNFATGSRGTQPFNYRAATWFLEWQA
jgi:hypothetical protein